ncbi:MAG: tRNA 2-thiouridine(34) synthase MnmA [Candidatus Coatesbacteria bacterium]|nr:tRNA 2-thiouridine(34) synthase MnmA [Candidatus Coatesbacteria bacterium]
MNDFSNLPPKGSSICVALSGGVDSAVSAAILKEMEYEIVSATLILCKNAENNYAYTSKHSRDDVLKISNRLGIKHFFIDASDLFKEIVLSDFNNEYEKGRTPNPCVRCNALLKWDIIMKKMREIGIHYLATGHYAGISKIGQNYFISKACNETAIDQSYMLWMLDRKYLPYTILPLNSFTKQQVREKAIEYEIEVADKKGSQDLCFIYKYKYYAKSRLREESGNIRLADGTILGRHKGLSRYTVGQRSGLGLAKGKPLYIVSMDADKNEIKVSFDVNDLKCRKIKAINANWFNNDDFKEYHVLTKIRYNSKPVSSLLSRISENEFTVEFLEQPYAATKGQSVVCYIDERILCGGIINEVE